MRTALAAVWVSAALAQAPDGGGALAHFHHLHLNVTDPAAAIDFYTQRFDSEKARFAGLVDGVWAQKSWLLFIKVAAPPPWEPVSSIWHFGWGAEDMKAAYQKQLDLGSKFFTPLTDISELTSFPGFYYAYVQAPDGQLIELNTANHHRFGHLHLFSEDPVSAGEWYMKHFGATRRGNRPPSREPRLYKGVPVGPAMSLMMDNVNIIIYPAAYIRAAYKEHWKDRTALEPTQGRAVDHVGFSVDNLDEAIARLKKDGVTVTAEPRSLAGGKVKFAFVEGPDRIRIEVIEGHPHKE